MSHMVPFLKKLHSYAGFKLYLNSIGMAIISVLDGLTILMLIPMLSLIGLSSSGSSETPFFSLLLGPLNRFPENERLPIMLVGYIVIITLQSILQRQQAITNMKIQQGYIGYLRTQMYQALMQANWTLFLRKRKSDFTHMMIDELARISQGVFQLTAMATSFIFTAIQIGLAFILSPQLTLFVVGCGILLGLFARRFIRKSDRVGTKTSELAQSYMGGITEHFNGMKDIKSNRLEKHYLSWFRNLNREMELNMVNFVRLQSTSKLFYSTTAAVVIALFVMSSHSIFQVTGEQLILIILIFSRLWPRFSAIQSSWEQVMMTRSAFRNYTQLLQECERSKEAEQYELEGEPLLIQRGIECRNVYYKYDEKASNYALQNICLHIPANSMTAIVGRSGAGKSTLIDLLIGLIRPESGSVVIDDVPLTADNLFSLRRSVSYVSQDPFLFHASIRNNLMQVQPNATEEQLWEALRFSASEEFVRRLPEGLDTLIGDRGVRLSGGERQRIVLARAILRRPSILVLDEATSALDNENEAKIQSALEQLKGRMTIIVIAHRLSTIRNADQVIVIEQGRVVQEGAYQQLSMETKGSFSKLLAYQQELGR